MKLNDEDRALMKEAFREAAKEWLDDLMASFGRWSFMTLLGAFAVAMGYMILTAGGWHK